MLLTIYVLRCKDTINIRSQSCKVWKFNIHGVAAEDEFLDALHHVGEDAAYGSCREGCVVARHVLGELVDADGCGDCRTGIVLAVRSWELFVVVFY